MPPPIRVAFRSDHGSLAGRLRRFLSGLTSFSGDRRVHGVPAIAIPFRHLLVHLAQGQLLAIQEGKGCTIRCLSGGLWITQDASSRDVVLRAREEFVLDRPGLALVQAAEEGIVCVVRPTLPAARECVWQIELLDMGVAQGTP